MMADMQPEAHDAPDEPDATRAALRAQLPAYLSPSIGKETTFRDGDGNLRPVGDFDRDELVAAGLNYDFTDRGWRTLASRPFIRKLGDNDPRFAPQACTPAQRRIGYVWRALAALLAIGTITCGGMYLVGGTAEPGVWLIAALTGLALTVEAGGRGLPVPAVSDAWIDFVRETAQEILLDKLNAEEKRTRPRASIADVQAAFDGLKQAWGQYRLNRAEYFLEMPVLRDGNVPETRAYQDAMLALEDALNALTAGSTQQQVDDAAALAEAAWHAWHTARDHAAEVKISDRAPTERAALMRLDRLVQRLAHESTPDSDRPKILAEIKRCIDQITTVPVSWETVRAFPELVARGPLPELTAGPPKQPPAAVDEDRDHPCT